LHGQEVKDVDRPIWQALYQRGQQSHATNEFTEALRFFAEAAKIDPWFAELQFRMGQCALGLSNLPAARSSFESARDADALPFRTDSTLNDVTRDVAGRFAGQGVQLLDAEAELAAQSPQGIPGEEFFYDHVHFTFDGNTPRPSPAQQVEKSLPSRSGARRRRVGVSGGLWAAPGFDRVEPRRRV
jgi:tetratricopeptide (TPR) repeat protein